VRSYQRKIGPEISRARAAFGAGATTQQGNMQSSLSATKTFLYLLMTLCLLNCSGRQLRSDSERIGYRETGQASFYAMKYHLRKTASGERRDQNALTAAHRTLPFGTRVKVTNLKNGKSVTVKINDRGPFVKSRIIDLTQTAFKKIGGIEAGLIEVAIEVVK